MRRKELHEETIQSGRSPARDKAHALRVKKVYDRLSGFFGPQGWWPVAVAGGGAARYRTGFYGPLNESQMFEICAGAVLTQNTAWTNALASLTSLRRAGSLEPGAICRMRTGELRELIRSSGFYRQKAEYLRNFSRHISLRRPEGLKKWFSASAAADLRRELLGIKGIGPETADSMALYAGLKPVFVVDAYTHRIFGRLGLISGNYAALQEFFERALPRDHRVYNEYHALIVALGKDYCRRTGPICGKCTLRNMCATGRLRRKNDHRRT